MPDQILTDQGSAFTAQLISQLCELSGVQRNLSTVYHAQSHRLVERTNQTLLQMLRKYVLSQGPSWDRHLSILISSFNDTPSETLKVSPHQLVYGRNLSVALSLLKAHWEGAKEFLKIPVADYLSNLQTALNAACTIATENLVASQTAQKTLYDKKARPVAFSKGEAVAILIPSRENKLQPKWEPGYTIIQELENNNFQVKHATGKTATLHANRLKKYQQCEALKGLPGEGQQQNPTSTTTTGPEQKSCCTINLCQGYNREWEGEAVT